MVLLRNCGFLALAVVCLVGEIESAGLQFNPDDLQKELGYFSQCKGKKINYPATAIADGFKQVPGCISMISFAIPGSPYSGVELSKPCVALCVAVQMGIVDKDTRLYNYEVAVKPLYATVNSTDPNIKNDQDVIDIQANALKRCGTTGNPRFLLEKKCDEAVRFDDCIRKASVTDCGNAAEPPHVA